MIKFFRHIRKSLLLENKTSKYFKYAIGEVLLIMIGIFMALQLQNWNEKRKQESQFKVTLEQLYTTIKYDAEAFFRHTKTLEFNILNLNNLIDYPDSIPNMDLPFVLYDLTYNGRPHTSESIYYSKDLNYNPENKKQKELSKEILNYINGITSNEYFDDERLEHALQYINIPFPKEHFDDGSTGWDDTDSTYYSASDFKNLHDLVRSQKFKAILKTVRTYKIYNHANARNMYNDGLSIRELIKDYYPEVKVSYKDVGIIGTAINGFDDIGAKSTPMKLTNEEKSIWEVTMHLKEGVVKFRCRDSWAQNWGVRGKEAFPKGKAVQDGQDIPLPEEGNYRVVLNLTENTYEFIKQDD